MLARLSRVRISFDGARLAGALLLVLSLGLFLTVLISTFSSVGLKEAVLTLTSNEVSFALSLSLTTSATSTLIALWLSIHVAYFLSRYDFYGKTLLEVLILLPYALTPVALGTLLLVFFSRTSFGVFLDSLFNVVFNVNALLLVQFLVSFSVMTNALKSYLDSVDVEYESVAYSLGYDRLRTLYKVTLPMIKNGVITAYALGFLKAFSDFGASVMLAGATLFKTSTLPITIYLFMSSGEVDKALTAVGLDALVSMFALIVIKKSAAGVKYGFRGF